MKGLVMIVAYAQSTCAFELRTARTVQLGADQLCSFYCDIIITPKANCRDK